MPIRVQRHRYHEEHAVTLTAGFYTAMVLPEIGGNLVSFQDVDRGLSFLRTPTFEDLDDLRAGSVEYGIPVLFPPNRIEDGRFTVQGRTYDFPVNEEKTHNHLHGLLTSLPWEVVKAETKHGKAFVELVQTVHEGHSVYRYFPHTFTMVLRYTLSNGGLQQDVKVVNHGANSMPFMLGFHTTLNVPFAKGSKGDDYTMTAAIGERWEMSERKLPTGQIQVLSVEEERMKTGEGAAPFYTAMDHHYTASPQGESNFFTLTDHRLGIRFNYDAGARYKHWMIFNNFGRGGFVCPEPQTCIVNAPNTSLSSRESGFLLLNPGETWSETSRMWIDVL